MAELQEKMCSAEYAEWLAYERLEGPLGPGRDDWRAAMIASTVANAMRDSKKGRPYTPDQFIPDWAAMAGLDKPAKTPDEVAEIGKGFFRRLAARGSSSN